MNIQLHARYVLLAGLVCTALPLAAAQDDKVSNVANTVHNLSASTSPVNTNQTTQVCVFCHTPHGSSNFPGSPLWNRSTSGATYTPYTSSSLDAETIMGGSLDSPAGSSKLCLSCHDGTLALGAVNVYAGAFNPTPFTMTSATMPDGSGSLTGFTRNLGISLLNDHPISLNYITALATADGELFDPASAAHIGVRGPGVRPTVPLEPTGGGGEAQIQCGTCHDPHLYDPVSAALIPPVSIKFLRLNRFQQGAPAAGSFTIANDMVCLACHDKEGWSTSAHALPAAADETYVTGTPTSLREIPVGMPVWQVGCLNCHDTHTVHGARRLLREGTDSPATPKSGGSSAIEEACYQCHSIAPIISNAGQTNNNVPDIKTDFTQAGSRHMPITSTEQLGGGTELHDITNADFSESQTLLGVGNLNNRHVECTDCHNPHRVMKDPLFNGPGTGTEGTHAHVSGHTNIASGVLRGTWGVEPTAYTSAAFLSLPTSWSVKQGDGGIGAANAVGSNWVTREYQVCFKCHSNYGYNDNGVYPTGNRPVPDGTRGQTPVGTNNLNQYTNQAMEFQAPLAQKNGTITNRSWHPVMDNTGRTPAIRTMANSAGGTNMWLAPWNGLGNVGVQTMYCADCHGSLTAVGTVVPSGNNPWGPHGSTQNFILKGVWGNTTGSGAGGTGNDALCFRCHNYTNYATDANEGNRNGFQSGFGGSRDTNLHAFHANQLNNRIRCNWCHVAVPHGWKNKAFLVNLNNVGAEAGLGGVEVAIANNAAFYNQGPYYMNAKLKIRTFATSGNWSENNCGSASSNPSTGRDWMRDVCDPPGGP